MNGDSRAILGLLALIATVVAAAALRASYAVTMPVAVAAIVIAALWPVKARLESLVPPWLAYLGTVGTLLLVFVGFSAGIWFASAAALKTFLEQEERFRAMLDQLTGWVEALGLPEPGAGLFERLVQVLQPILAGTYSVLAYLGFIAVLVMLGLPAVIPFRRRLGDALEGTQRRELVDAVDEISLRIRQYLGVTTLMSLVTGAAVALWCFLLGLDLALSWGILNFLLNYIPVVGNVIGIFPPVLYAILQFEGWQRPTLLFLGLAAIQVAISNFLYPMMQGRSMALPPVVIVVALTFWSWVWGIVGALIAIPLTVAAIIAFDRFESTRWLATLLSEKRR